MEPVSRAVHLPGAVTGPIAQGLEQATHNRLVGGSNPSGPTILSSAASYHSP